MTARAPLSSAAELTSLVERLRSAWDPDKPRLLTMAPGWATHFRRAMDEFVGHMRDRLPAVFDSKEVADQQQELQGRTSWPFLH